jgi:tetratricopeptide (TPR) repeat protein
MNEKTELILHHYAYSCYRQGLWDKSIATFRHLVMFYPNKGTYWYGLGSSLMLSGNDEEAAHAFQIASITNPEDPRPLAYWAECSARLGRQDIAVSAIKQAEKKANCDKFSHFINQVHVIKEQIIEVAHGTH